MANTGFLGTVADFIDCADSNLLAEAISGNLGRRSESEWWSWRDGLQKLANDLRLASREDRYSWIRELTIVCELCFTGSQHRADIVLGGMDSTNNPCLLVLEAKQWSSDSVEINENDSHYVVANAYRDVTSRQLHPILQARGYASSLQQSEALQNAQVLSGAYLPNMRRGNPAIEELSIRRENQDFLVLLDGSINLRDILSGLFSGGDRSGVISQIIEDAEFVFSDPPDYDVSPDDCEDDDWSVDDESEENQAMSSMVSFEQVFDGLGYHGSREEFVELCDRNLIAHRIRESLGVNMRETTSEFRSWREGLYRLARVLRDVDLPIHVACEFRSQAGMIDVVLGGISADSGSPTFLVIELKQWSESGISNNLDDWMIEAGRIHAHVGGPNFSLTMHPYWQARRYVRGLRNGKMYFEECEDAVIHGIAYLPNVSDPNSSEISNQRFFDIDSDYPQIFYGSNIDDFVSFLNDFFSNGESENVLLDLINSPHGMTRYITGQVEDMYIRGLNGELEDSRLVPSGEQQRSIDSIIDQINSDTGRQVHLVQGGPGTGKTIVGLYVLFSQATIGSMIRYTAGNNPTPRTLRRRLRGLNADNDIEDLILTGGQLGRRLDNLCRDGPLDLLIIDEAQSLVRKGQAPPPELATMIESARNLVIMFDERQSLNPRDQYRSERIREIVNEIEVRLGETITVSDWRLQIQQRAGQLSNLLPFIGNILGYGDELPPSLNFDITVHDSATSMGNRILELNAVEGLEAALMASYCWEFITRGDSDNPELWDLVFDEGVFERKWNRQGGRNGDMTFMTDPTRDERAGYAPEMQGQELHHAGLIIGPDIQISEGEIAFNPNEHHVESDVFGSVRSENGKMNLINEDRGLVEGLLRNQYWILFTRGTRSLHLYSEDPEVRDFLKNRISEFQEE